jgi:hypothetical protein
MKNDGPTIRRLLDVSGHLRDVTNEVQGKDMLIIEMYDNIKACKFKVCYGKTN